MLLLKEKKVEADKRKDLDRRLLHGIIQEACIIGLRDYCQKLTHLDIMMALKAIQGNDQIISALKENIRVVLEHLFHTATDQATYVPVDYTRQDALNQALAALNPFHCYMGVNPSEIPLVGTGRAAHWVHEVNFSGVIEGGWLFELLAKRGQELGFKQGFVCADPMTALHFGKLKQGRGYPVAILFYDLKGRLCYMVLRERGQETDLGLDLTGPKEIWTNQVSFLAVPNNE